MPAPSDSVCSSPIALSYSCIAAVPGTLLSGLFVCPDELQYNQADVGLFVRTSSNTIRQMSVCMSGQAPIQSGRRGFKSLAGSVLEEAIGGIGGPCKIVYDQWYKNRQKSVSFSGHISDGLSVVLVRAEPHKRYVTERVRSSAA